MIFNHLKKFEVLFYGCYLGYGYDARIEVRNTVTIKIIAELPNGFLNPNLLGIKKSELRASNGKK